MNREFWHDLDWFFGGILIALITLMFVLTMGCSTMPRPPEVHTVEVGYPEPCIITIDAPPEPEYEAYPEPPPILTKEWMAEVVRITLANKAMREDYINRLSELIAEHNRLEPQCKQ